MAVSKEWQLIRSWLRRTYNREVHEFFRDLPENADLDNSTGRSASKAVCLIGANDSQGIATIKRQNFEYIKSKVGLFPKNHDYANVPDFSVEEKPQIQLWFYEKYSAAKAANRRQKTIRLSFRIHDPNWSLPEAGILATRIKAQFATPIFSIDKGKLKFTYYNKKKAHEFKLLVDSEAEAKRVLGALFNVLQETPEWKYLNESNRNNPDDELSQTVRVLGKTVKIDPLRPNCKLYFRHAIAKVPPLNNDFPLVDTTGDYWNALETARNPYLASTYPNTFIRNKNSPLTP